MYSFLARQPIFDTNGSVYGYELLHRTTMENNSYAGVDGNSSTKNVISDAFTLFGLQQLTNSKIAFINFTRDLILEKYPTLLPPEMVVIEILECVEVNSRLIDSVAELKKKGYTIAIDDYIGQPNFDKLLPYVDILKVDFLLTTEEQQRLIAQKYKSNVYLLAEKVETYNEYSKAKEFGYSFFQGYFFSKPHIVKKVKEPLSTNTMSDLINNLFSTKVDFTKCGDFLKKDPVLLLKLLKRVNTVEYCSDKPISEIREAFIREELNPLKKWLLIILAHTNNATVSNDNIRKAVERGLFLESLYDFLEDDYVNSKENLFILGLFSMLDVIIGNTMEEILEGLYLPVGIREVLINSNKDNIYFHLLELTKIIEKDNEVDSVIDRINLKNIDFVNLKKLYNKAIIETDILLK